MTSMHDAYVTRVRLYTAQGIVSLGLPGWIPPGHHRLRDVVGWIPKAAHDLGHDVAGGEVSVGVVMVEGYASGLGWEWEMPLTFHRESCTLPPPGWRCTREPGHKGPCAALPT